MPEKKNPQDTMAAIVGLELDRLWERAQAAALDKADTARLVDLSSVAISLHRADIAAESARRKRVGKDLVGMTDEELDALEAKLRADESNE